MIEIVEAELSVDRCLEAVRRNDCGGVAVFLGTVRDHSEAGSTDHLEYEAYPEMATEVIQRIVDEAARRWPLGEVAVQHRTGRLELGEVSVIVAVSSGHRAEAFEACRYIIDELKMHAPIWKKEVGEAGEVWVGGPASAKA